MSRWTHAQCEQCWCERNIEWGTDDRPNSIRTPSMVRGQSAEEMAAGLRPCCFCGHPTFVGIFVRHDPSELELCQGHDD